MTISLIGAHGTGKTRVFKQLKASKPNWQYFTENLRHLMPEFGYADPYQMVSEIGSGVFQLMNINAWSVIDPRSNEQFKTDVPAVCDGAVISNFVYFQALKKKPIDFELEKVLIKVASYYASLIDYFIYFPIGMFPLKADPMRPPDVEFQKQIDTLITSAFVALQIPDTKIHHLQAPDAPERVQEIIQLIEKSKESAENPS